MNEPTTMTPAMERLSAIAYLTSKESDIISPFEKMAAQNKLAIQMGRVSGIEFPKKTKPPVNRSAKEKEAVVMQVNELRKDGLSYDSACKEVGVSHRSYERWRKDFGIPKFVRQDKASKAYMEILKLVNAGKPISEACAKYGEQPATWRTYMVRNGLYESGADKARDLTMIIKVNLLRKSKGITIKEACKKVGCSLQFYYTYKSRI